MGKVRSMNIIDAHRDISADFWGLFTANAVILQKNDDADWRQLVAAMDDIVETYKDTMYDRFARDMYKTFLGEIERLSKMS